MALNIIFSLFSDEIFTIKDEGDGAVKYPGLKIESVQLGFQSESTVNPLTEQLNSEDNQVKQKIQDDLAANKVMRPTTINIKGYLDDNIVVLELINDFLDNTKTFTVTSKSVITENASMTSCIIIQSEEMLSAAEIDLEFSQAISWEDLQYDPADSSDESTYGSRVDPKPTLLDGAESLYNKISSNLSF